MAGGAADPAGGRLWLALEEIGARGWATVEDISPCPPLASGPGRVVLLTVTHRNDFLYRLGLRGAGGSAQAGETGGAQELEVTGYHRLWSASRQDWVAVKDLHPQERLLTRSGEVTVDTRDRVPGVHRVYNFEVETQHCYYAGENAVLAHNDCDSGTMTSNSGAPNKPAVEALFEHGDRVFHDVNPTAREAMGMAPYGRIEGGFGNHPDAVVIQKSIDAGNRGGVGRLYVEGKPICDLCKGDIKLMGRKADLDGLHVEEAATGKNYFFDRNGLKKNDDGGMTWTEAEIQ